MRFLLINTNPAVSKLVGASVSRMGYGLTEIGDYSNLPLDTYIFVIVDSDSYKAGYMDDLLSISFAPSLIYLKTQGADTPQGITYAIEKPFLPTDFMAFMVSILQSNPKMSRFITSEIEQLKNSVLKNIIDAQIKKEQDALAAAATQGFYGEKDNKAPIFDIQESENEIFNKSDIFANLSEDFERLYKGENNAADETPAPYFQTPIEEPIFKQEDIKSDADALSLNTNDFLSEFEKLSQPIEQTQNADNIPSSAGVEDDTTDKELLKRTGYAPNENVEKINLDFDIFDKIEEREKLSKENASDAETTNLEDGKIDFKFDDGDITPQSNEDGVSERSDFGFGDLAKEFDDLIQNKQEDAKEDQTQTKSGFEEQKASSEKSSLENAFGDLNEKEMREALQDSGMLPKPSELEVVKSEIENVVEQSVKGILQSQILRDVLKGLKMNITITFEDK
jgi:uncharacterized membrane protein